VNVFGLPPISLEFKAQHSPSSTNRFCKPCQQTPRGNLFPSAQNEPETSLLRSRLYPSLDCATMAPNLEASRVEILTQPTSTITGFPREQHSLFSMKWAVGEKWWHRSKFVATKLLTAHTTNLSQLHGRAHLQRGLIHPPRSIRHTRQDLGREYQLLAGRYDGRLHVHRDHRRSDK
jgi:hypothetical protein